MKKVLLIALTAALVLSLLPVFSACNQRDESANSSEDENGDNIFGGGVYIPTMDEIIKGMGGYNLISEFNNAQKSHIANEAEKVGYIVIYNEDGSTAFEHIQTGEQIIQSNDGSWTLPPKDEISIEWPSLDDFDESSDEGEPGDESESGDEAEESDESEDEESE